VPDETHPSLTEALADSIKAARHAASDAALRVEVPFDWPVADILSDLISSDAALRVGVLRPFQSPAQLAEEPRLSTQPDEITRWRNGLMSDQGLIVFGDATGRDEAGLFDMTTLLSRPVLRSWRERVDEWLRATVPSDAPRSLVSELFDLVEDGQIDGVAMDEFVAAIAETDEPLATARSALWIVGLLPDRKVLDASQTGKRLSLNLEIRELLISSADTMADAAKMSRIVAAASTEPAAAAAVQFRETAHREELKAAQLEDLERIISRSAPPPPNGDRSLSFLEFLDEAPTNLDGEAIAHFVADLFADFDPSELRDQELSRQVQLGSQRRVVRVTFECTKTGIAWAREQPPDADDAVDEDSDEDGSQPPTEEHPTEGKAFDPTLAALVAIDSERDWTRPHVPKATVTASDLARAAESQDGINQSDIFVPLVSRYLDARNDLAPFEPWLQANAMEMLVASPDARSAAHRFLAAWRDLAEAASEQASDVIRLHVSLLEALWGTAAEDDPPRWVTLGPFHPYVLEPILSVVGYLLASLGEEGAGSRCAWALGRSVPSYRAIWARDTPLYLSSVAPAPTFEVGAKINRPPVSAGRGFLQVVTSYRQFHPYVDEALVITLVDPPRGRAIPRDLQRLDRQISPLRVYLVSTGSESLSLADFGGDVQFLGTFPSIAAWLDGARARSHLTFYFTDYAGAGESSTAAPDGFTPGAHVAPRISIRSTLSLSDPSAVTAYVTFEPRESNQPVILSQQIGDRRSGVPKSFETTPMLSAEERSELVALSEVCDWVVVGAPAPLGLVPPRNLDRLTLLGKESYGNYGLFVYAGSLFAIRRILADHLNTDSPVTVPEAEELEERLTSLALNASRGVLALAHRGSALQEHLGLLVANHIAGVSDE
jgi:hypothetical protein